MRLRIILIFFVLCIPFSSSAIISSSPPSVAVSILPLYSLVSGVMKDVGTPVLLMAPHKSPHVDQLSPREVHQLQNARIVFWVGPNYEIHLTRAIQSIANKATVITFIKTEGIVLYPHRQGGLWSMETDHCHEHAGPILSSRAGQQNEEDYLLTIDGHIWLDPINACAMVKTIAGILTEQDPSNKPLYQKNAERMLQKLTELDQKITHKLEPVREIPYIVFHDAYQYLDQRYHTNAVGALTTEPAMPPASDHLKRLVKYGQRNPGTCVFFEPQFPSAYAEVFKEVGMLVGQLDPLGMDLTADEKAYFIMMDRLSSVLKCQLELGLSLLSEKN